jgi:hypothetical protein
MSLDDVWTKQEMVIEVRQPSQKDSWETVGTYFVFCLYLMRKKLIVGDAFDLKKYKTSSNSSQVCIYVVHVAA